MRVQSNSTAWLSFSEQLRKVLGFGVSSGYVAWSGMYVSMCRSLDLSGLSSRGGGGGGTQPGKGYQLRSDRWRGGCPHIILYCMIGGLSESVLLFHIK